MKIHNIDATGSFTYNGVDLSNLTGSTSDSGSFSTQILNLNQVSSSLNSFTSSINTTIKSKLDSESVISGSIQVSISDTTGYSTFSSSVSSSVGSLSGSVATTTSGLSSSIGSLSSSVATTTSDLSSSVGSLSSSVATNTSGLAGRITTIEGRYATTGSNIFVGSQVITGSLYITNDMVVQGCSCLQNITASAVSIGTNTVVLNTATPAVRFAGISVQDSGSNAGVTGSIYWDGLCNRWIYSNPSDIGYSGGMLLSGPRTSTLGSESPLTCNYIAKSGGGDHLYDSCVIDNGTTVCVNANLIGTGTACFTGAVTGGSTLTTTGDITISNTTSNLRLFLTNTTTTTGKSWYLNSYSNGNLYIGNTTSGDIFNFSCTGAATFNSNITATSALLQSANTAAVVDILTLYNPSQTSAGVRQLFNSGYGNLAAIKVSQRNNSSLADDGQIEFQVGSDAVLDTKMTILNTGYIGIGTNCPKTILDVVTGSNTTLASCSDVIAKFKGSLELNSLSTASSGTIDRISFNKSHTAGINVSTYTLGEIRSFTNGGFSGGLDFFTGRSLGAGAYGTCLTMRLDDAGRVGIGTVVGTASLGIGGSGAQTTANLTDGGSRIGIIESIPVGGEGGNGGALVLGSDTWGNGSGRGQIALKALLINGSGCGTSDLAFSLRNDPSCSNLTERMRITSGGIVVIQSSLNICNGGAINMTIPNGNNGGSIRMACCTGSNEGDMFLTGGGGSGILIAGNGRLGIGTTCPSEKLEILGPDGSGAAVRWRMGGGRKSGYLYSDSVGVGIYDTNLNDAGIYLAQNTQIDFRVGGTQKMRITSGGTIFNPQYIGASIMGGYSLIGTISPGNTGNGYLHARINTIGSMMYWIKVLGYSYVYGIIEGLGGGYIGGGTGGVNQGFVSGSIAAMYQNNGYLEIVVSFGGIGSTSNRWGSITFFGGTDNITTVQPLEIMTYSWTSTTDRVY